MKKHALLLLALIGYASNCLSATLTFDPPTLPNGSVRLDSYTEAGFAFTGRGSQTFGHTDNQSINPYNSTAHLSITKAFAQLSELSGKLFSLESIDIAEYSTAFATPRTLAFIGVQSDDSQVNYSFTTDGIIDGTGSAIDFETALLPATFTNLKRVEFHYESGFAIDNLQVTIIPEPSTCLYALLVTPLAFYRNRKRDC